MATLLGALLVSLGLDSGQFHSGADAAIKKQRAMEKAFTASGEKMISAGAAMTVGITAPFVALVTKAIPAATESRQAMAQVTAALASMGPVAGRTAEQLQGAAGKLEDLSNFDDDDILKKVTANLLTFGNVSGDVFDGAQLAAVNLSARLEQDLQSSAIQLGKALNDPVKGVTALQKVGVSFTAQQKTQIAAMTAAGNAAGAQRLILAELEKQFGGAAKAQRDATPNAGMQQQWRQFEETVGELALKVLPPLTDGLTKALDAFNRLDPAVQRTAVGAVAIAAAAGPVLAVFGNLVKLGAPLLATLGAEGGIAAGAKLLPGLLGPVAFAATAVYLAFQHWDEIKPWIDGVVSRSTEAAVSINAKLAEIQSGAEAFDQRMGIPSRTEFFDHISARATMFYNTVDGVFRSVGASELAFEQAVAGFVIRVGMKFDDLARAVPAAMQRMYAGVKTWLQDRLGGTIDWLGAKLTQAGDFFYNLYDRTVGHSYIPDMVDEIGQHMGRLEQNLVQPAGSATERAAQAFEQMQQRVRGLLDQLFPEEVKFIEFRKNIDDLVAYAKKAKLSPEQLDEALRRNRNVYRGDKPDTTFDGGITAPDVTLDARATEREIDDLRESIESSWGAGKAANDNFAQSFEDMAQRIGSALQDMQGAIEGGGFLDIVQAGVNLFAAIGGAGGFGKGIQSNLNQPTSFGGSSTAGQYQTPGYGGGRALGGPVVPGKYYRVNEKTNRSEYFAPQTRGTIIPAGGIGPAAPIKLIVEANDYFDARVDERSSGRAVDIMGTGQRVQARRGRQRLA